MERDNVYIFDKITFERSLLGEIQSEFNMCMTIDGTKDSVDIIVVNFSDVEIEPYTICWHEHTNTWWVVSHDKIERRMNENGFIYFHNLELLGAIELLNARDLIDCAFNDNTYTQDDFIKRLFSLSTFEYSWEYANFPSGLYNLVDFIKTFENYTLLSALREFLDAYNMCAKLTFTTQAIGKKIKINKAKLHLLYKTGNGDLESHDIDDFSDVKENKTMDKNSFGTCVISNANNVVSSQAKTYPSTGLLSFTGREYEITFNNAVLRLPNNVYKLNWLKMIYPHVRIQVWKYNADSPLIDISLPYEYDSYSVEKLNEEIDDVENNLSAEQYQELKENVELILKRAKDCFTITLYNGVQYNPNDTFTKPDNVPHIPVFGVGAGSRFSLMIADKSIKENLKYPKQCVAWERGSNIISGFELLASDDTIELEQTDGYYLPLTSGTNPRPQLYKTSDNNVTVCVNGNSSNPSYLTFDLSHYTTQWQPKFIVNYIPMNDMKIKVDNNRDKRDTQLYNQNGKITDSFALSKLLNSYSKEISSDNVVRYGQYYDFDSIPKVGSFVQTENGFYVINNVSMTFYQNEKNEKDKFGYFIDCEFNMSKWVSTKSLMVNPNTNIRDYGIPQNYNVKRKQLYRDFYELSYETYSDANQDTFYLLFSSVVPFSQEYVKTNDYTTFIKLYYDEPIGTPSYHSWYYQLDCTTFVLQKQLVLLCDFLDNNIIGYCQNNRNFIFDISNLFNQNSLINTPISYVDDYGKFKEITLLFINQENHREIDYDYYDSYSLTPTYDALATQVFIPIELYDLAYETDRYDFMIYEEDYNKDALEVPVFEYCCQVDDSEDVLIGDNILQQYDDLLYFYDMKVGASGEIMNTNVNNPNNVAFLELDPYAELNNAIKFEYHDNYTIYITYWQKVRYHTDTGVWEYITQKDIPTDVDIAIFRHACRKDDYYDSDIEQIKELMLICRKVPSESIIDNGKTLVLKINHYLLK